jgi:hypothetical protein
MVVTTTIPKAMAVYLSNTLYVYRLIHVARSLETFGYPKIILI